MIEMKVNFVSKLNDRNEISSQCIELNTTTHDLYDRLKSSIRLDVTKFNLLTRQGECIANHPNLYLQDYMEPSETNQMTLIVTHNLAKPIKSLKIVDDDSGGEIQFTCLDVTLNETTSFHILHLLFQRIKELEDGKYRLFYKTTSWYELENVCTNTLKSINTEIGLFLKVTNDPPPLLYCIHSDGKHRIQYGSLLTSDQFLLKGSDGWKPGQPFITGGHIERIHNHLNSIPISANFVPAGTNQSYPITFKYGDVTIQECKKRFATHCYNAMNPQMMSLSYNGKEMLDYELLSKYANSRDATMIEVVVDHLSSYPILCSKAPSIPVDDGRYEVLCPCSCHKE